MSKKSEATIQHTFIIILPRVIVMMTWKSERITFCFTLAGTRMCSITIWYAMLPFVGCMLLHSYHTTALCDLCSTSSSPLSLFASLSLTHSLSPYRFRSPFILLLPVLIRGFANECQMFAYILEPFGSSSWCFTEVTIIWILWLGDDELYPRCK